MRFRPGFPKHSAETVRRELEELDLSANCISTDAAVKVAVALLESQCPVQLLLLQGNSISGSTEYRDRALAQLPSLRLIDLNFCNSNVADCCSVFALMISSNAPTATFMLTANLFEEFPALFSRNRTSAGRHHSSCWCGGTAIAHAMCFIFMCCCRWLSHPPKGNCRCLISRHLLPHA